MRHLWFRWFVGICAAIVLLIAADETRAYLNLTRHFPSVQVGPLAIPCSAEHFYGRRISLIVETSRQGYYACHDWRADRWELTVIPGTER